MANKPFLRAAPRRILPCPFTNSTALERQPAFRKPMFKHDKSPHQTPVVLCMAVEMRPEELVNELRPYYVALLQILQRALRDAGEPSMRDEPGAERQTEAVLGLLDDWLGQELAQRLLEEVAQF